MYGLTPKEIVELRIKCLAPYVATGSKAGLLKNEVLDSAEGAWEYAIKPLKEGQGESTAKAS